METPVELVPLNCIRCRTPIPADFDEVAWVCQQCEQGQQLGDSGLLPLEVHYSQEIAPNQTGKPFWICEGRVTLQRDTYGRGKSNKDAQQFWSQTHKFIIPAFPYPLEKFTTEGVRWLVNPPEMRPGPMARFEPVTVAVEDVQVWAEFLVVALEAERKDKVKEIAFTLELDEPLLWVLP